MFRQFISRRAVITIKMLNCNTIRNYRSALFADHHSAVFVISSTLRVPHTKLQQRCRACSWACVHVEARRACHVREEFAAGLTAAQGCGAPSVWAARATENFAPLPKHRACRRALRLRARGTRRAGLFLLSPRSTQACSVCLLPAPNRPPPRVTDVLLYAYPPYSR